MPQMEWHKVHGYRWLTGSIRSDLHWYQIGVWADLLSLAGLGRRRGYIERSEGIGYDRAWIASFTRQPLKVLNDTIERCKEEGRIQELDNGVLFITNWDEYQAVPDGKKSVGRMPEFKRRLLLQELIQQFPEDAKEAVSPMFVSTETGEILNPPRPDRGT